MDYQQELIEASRKSVARMRSEYMTDKSQSYDVLVLSGGGPLGAFGAGFLKGWGEVREQGYTRPFFDSVSGVSTGALIAPFAFVGTNAAYDEIVRLYSEPDKDLVIPRAILAFLAGHGAYYDTSGLHKRVSNSITPSLVKELIAGNKANRVLLVGATNLDFGFMRVWDLAEQAKQFSYENAHSSIVHKLMASSAIPGAFPPVEIDKFLYVDGGASMQVVSGIDDRQWLYDSEPENLEFVEHGAPIKIRIWVVINNKLMMDPEVTRPTWSAIAQRSLVALMRGSTLQTLQDMETFSQMINKHASFEVQMHYVAIPQSFDIPDTDRLFDKHKMEKLVELGIKMGKNPNSWRRKALRPGAPIDKSNY
ncbi:patatin-like phospholipase family protein [Pseudoalteromonas peptidolytica]|uniref:patatin-like phospholipase family protein n=1 Tax=Pseudoalteromonas peptidolytica TaxID=61150 RepID=UPI00298D9813|nr:patatin-like phospholipase family protein [Pseudoalteromonas peptidolytica]MDW7550405.1 patatin-like phospholipase family protein [Pseudoalteromonas peptidolytica]